MIIESHGQYTPAPDYLDAIYRAVMERDGRLERGEIRFRCAADGHADEHPSARWNPEKAVWRCDVCHAHGGCLDLGDKLGIPRPETVHQNGHAKRMDAPLGPAPDNRQRPRIVKTYDYRTEDNSTLLFQTVRYEPKDFKQRRPDPAHPGEWIWNLRDTCLVLYRLHELLTADESRARFLCAGEKDADRLAALGLVATTCPLGEGKWRDEYNAWLADQLIVILVDNDKAGRDDAEKKAASLYGVARSIRVVALSGLPEKGDVSDWLDAGGTVEQLKVIVTQTPEWQPRADTEQEPAGRKLRFMTGREIADETPEAIEWVIPNYAAIGALTGLDGKPKKGKTTWILNAAAACINGSRFMGSPTMQTSVVYLCEAGLASFRQTAARAGVLGQEGFHALFWNTVADLPWPDVVAEAVAYCKAVGARLLIIDTLPQWARMAGDSENNAGDALEAIRPLQDAAAQGIAVIILRHERKGSGEVGESARGSSAFSGAVDIVVSLRSAEGASRPTIRQLHALSRFDETPDLLVIEMTPDGYVSLGSETAVAEAEAREAILNAAPISEADALKEADLIEAAGVKRTNGRKAIEEHLSAGQLQRVGAGKRGDAFRYWRSTLSDTTQGPLSESNDAYDEEVF